jgi:hypothetical protein
MENRQGANRFVVEPPALDAAITGIQFRPGALRQIDAAGSGGSASVGLDGAAGCCNDNAAAADALIRAEEVEAEAARVARVVEEATGPSTDAFTMDDVQSDDEAVGGRGMKGTAKSATKSTAAVEDRVESAAATMAATSPGAVSVHASESSLGDSSSDDAASRSGSGRVREAVRSLEAGVSSETVAVRYGADDVSQGRPRGDSSGDRRRRARSASYVDGNDRRDKRMRDEAYGQRRGDRRVVTREDRFAMDTSAPLHSSQVPRYEGEYVPQFCPPPPFPTGSDWGVAAGGGSRGAERSHVGGRAARPAHRSDERSRDRQRDVCQARAADRHRDGRRSRSPRRPRQ